MCYIRFSATQKNNTYRIPSVGQKVKEIGDFRPFFYSIKRLKLGQKQMAIKRKTYELRQGDVLEVEEFQEGRYGAPGEKRQKKKKATKEEMERANQRNKVKLARMRLMQYFNPGDCFLTLTFEKSRRPADMKEAKKYFTKMMRKIRREYKKRGSPLFWIRNIERGTKGAWHIHMVINEIGDTAAIVKRAWKHGGVYCQEIRLSDKLYDEDFTKLANYITKSEKTEYRKEDGTPGKPRIKESSYSTSKNMPLPEPKPKRLVRWKKEVKPKKGYYIARIYEGENPRTGHPYRRYTMIRLNRRI